MKIWPLIILMLSGCAFAQWEGDYSLVKEQEGCPEGALVMTKERILFGASLSFELAKGPVKAQEDECFYSTKTDVDKNEKVLTITRKTERSKCKTPKFNGISDESLSFQNGAAEYSISSLDGEGKKQEELKCLYKKD